MQVSVALFLGAIGALSVARYRKKRVCVILVDNGKAWSPRNFVDMFKDLLFNSRGFGSFVVDVSDVANGLPLCKIDEYSAFIITGSRFNVKDGVDGKLPWFSGLVDLIKDIERRKDKRLYGCCFGHQVVAHALGGEVGLNPNAKGFILKFEDIQIESTNLKKLAHHCGCDLENCCNTDETLGGSVCNLVNCCSANSLNSVRLIVSHGDSVSRLPSCKCLPLGASSSCKYEAFACGKHLNILCTQGHPEMDYEYCIKDRILPAVTKVSKRLSVEQGEKADASFEGYSRQRGPDQLGRLITSFLLQ